MLKHLCIISLTALLTTPMTSCKDSKNKAKGTSDVAGELMKTAKKEDTPKVVRLATQDVKFKVEKDGKSYELDLDFPIEGSQPLLDSLRQHIYRSGIAPDCDCEKECINLNSNLSQLETNKDRRSLNAVFESIAETYMKHWVTLEWMMNYTSTAHISENKESHVTYSFYGDFYAGGAHGMPWKYALTFDAATGKTLGYADIFAADKLDELRKMVCEGIKTQYFEGVLQSERIDGYDFDLPVCTPALSKDGVMFSYAPYEIASYAEGSPSCILPYSQLKPLMTPKVLKMIGE